ncbi:hypothetical protein HBI79_211450 [Parastagonospora nodorum]|nr:hypothetical protein HBI79_211450 [Parastagonospora nodorum]
MTTGLEQKECDECTMIAARGKDAGEMSSGRVRSASRGGFPKPQGQWQCRTSSKLTSRGGSVDAGRMRA